MPSHAPTLHEAPILGTEAGDIIKVENGISFQWMPAPGDSYIADHSGTEWDWQTGTLLSTHVTGHGMGRGHVTFDGVTSSEPFSTSPATVTFWYTPGYVFELPSVPGVDQYPPIWSYDPATGVLDPQHMSFYWDDWIGVNFTVNITGIEWGHDAEFGRDVEFGQWQLVPAIHNVDIFGGGGNDTILGGQGQEMLYGGPGDDLIRASAGNDLLSGDAGNDALHAGTGNQTLLGGEGNDTLWGGSGAQLLFGGNGQDGIHGGFGSQTLAGGAGNDTLWGGSGAQFLQGWEGSDVLHAGSGNETLSGGTGRDTFDFATANGHDIITDFQPGQDIITIKSGFAGLAHVRVNDLLPHIDADRNGDAVLRVGNEFSLVLQHIPAQRVERHPADFFKL